MSKRLGYTFYPKDWRSDDKVIMLNAEERDMFRFFIDECHIKSSAKLEWNLGYLRRILGHNKQKVERIFKVLCSFELVSREGDYVIVPSVINRLGFIEEQSERGKLSRIASSENVTKEKEKEKQKEKGESEDPKVKFLKWFNESRTHHLKIPSNFNSLTNQDRINLSELRKDYGKEDFNKAIKSFCEDKWWVGKKNITPKHFLDQDNFAKFLNAYEPTKTIGQKLMG